VDPTDSSRQQTKGVTLQPGNYEWPFELMLGGDTTESVEGMREASIRYKLKATIARGKLVHDVHAYKQLRIIRTLQDSALDLIHAMSIEHIWPNKIDYSIVAPQKAVVFGSCVPLEMRFTPLLKGIEATKINIKLVEILELVLQSNTGVREHRNERDIDSWAIPVTREEHWQNVIQDTGMEGWEGQEGWVVNTSLGLPKKLTKCLQDVNTKGIKIRHKLKIAVVLNNPDGHISELRVTLPVSLFISPNTPLDEEGNIIRQQPNEEARALTTAAPPAYELHRLDQLYDDIDPVNLISPGPSGLNTPFRGHSRAGSTENIPALLQTGAVQPDLLAHRLHSMSLEQRNRNMSWNSNLSTAGTLTRTESPPQTADGSPSTPLTRRNSGESGANTPPEHVDFPEISELSKVPSYQTAVRTPVRPLATNSSALPDYETALSAPSTAPGTPRLAAAAPSILDALETIPEPEHSLDPTPAYAPAVSLPHAATAPSSPTQSRRMAHQRQYSSGFHRTALHFSGDGDENRRLHLLQARSG
jgi:arrestin-related trafficking adapter 4/5/7